MPDDKLKRISNLLNQLQVRTALESTNISPQYLQTEIARRDAQKLENAGNKIDPVTKKPFNRSEKWLQSTGQQIPGLDSDGVSAMNALDIIGAGQLAKVGVNIAKDLPLKTAGRVITNTVQPFGYSDKLGELITQIKQYPLHTLKSVLQGKPIYMNNGITDEVLLNRYIAYRNLFKLEPSQAMLKIYPELKTAFTKVQRDGRDVLIPNPKTDLGREFLKHTTPEYTSHPVMGSFANKMIKSGDKTYQFIGDNWDFALNPDEVGVLKNAYSGMNIDIDKHILPQLIKNQFSTDPTKLSLMKVLTGKNPMDNTDLLRIMVDKHLNPTSFAGLRPVNSTSASRLTGMQRKIQNNSLKIQELRNEGDLSGDSFEKIGKLMKQNKALRVKVDKMSTNPLALSYDPKTVSTMANMERTANSIASNIRKTRAYGEEPTEAQLAALYRIDSVLGKLKSKAMFDLNKQPLIPFDSILNKHLPK